MIQTNNKRDVRIDYLRSLGTALTILAHVNPPTFLLNIRTFDVVLLVMVSSICSYKTKDILTTKEYLSYLLKRIKRLVIPAYVMLSITFVAFYCLYTVVFHKPFFWTSQQVIHSFLLLDSGIGYVWIARVYLIIAIFIPFLCRIHSKITKGYEMFFVIFLLMAACQIFFFLSQKSMCQNLLFKNYLTYAFPYMLASFCGLSISKSKFGLSFVFSLFLLIFIFLSIFVYRSSGFSPSQYKYPPSLYYISYGVVMSSIMYYLFGLLIPRHSLTNNMITWFSRNSYTIYLSHIPFIILLDSISKHYFHINWPIRFTLLIFAAIIVTIAVNYSQSILIILRKKYYEKQNAVS